MRPSMLWMLTAFGLALTGLALQYPVIHGRRTSSLMADLRCDLGYAPAAWWESIAWPLVIIAALAAIIILILARLLWQRKKASKRRQPPMEGD
jgi:hypothetical protein